MELLQLAVGIFLRNNLQEEGCREPASMGVCLSVEDQLNLLLAHNDPPPLELLQWWRNGE